MRFFNRSVKMEPVVEELVTEKPDESGQITVIINEMIYDNFLVHERIKDWVNGQRIIISNFNDLDNDFENTEYHITAVSNEVFIENHRHVILHCTIPKYLLRKMME